MTLDEQIKALGPLTQGAIGALAGHTNPQSMAVKRVRGSPLSAKQLDAVAERLLGLAQVARDMARAARRRPVKPAS